MIERDEEKKKAKWNNFQTTAGNPTIFPRLATDQLQLPADSNTSHQDQKEEDFCKAQAYTDPKRGASNGKSQTRRSEETRSKRQSPVLRCHRIRRRKSTQGPTDSRGDTQQSLTLHKRKLHDGSPRLGLFNSLSSILVPPPAPHGSEVCPWVSTSNRDTRETKHNNTNSNV